MQTPSLLSERLQYVAQLDIWQLQHDGFTGIDPNMLNDTMTSLTEAIFP